MLQKRKRRRKHNDAANQVQLQITGQKACLSIHVTLVAILCCLPHIKQKMQLLSFCAFTVPFYLPFCIACQVLSDKSVSKLQQTSRLGQYSSVYFSNSHENHCTFNVTHHYLEHETKFDDVTNQDGSHENTTID